MVRQFGIMNGLGGTVWDDEGAMVRVWAYERAMVRQFGMMEGLGETIRIKLLVFD